MRLFESPDGTEILPVGRTETDRGKTITLLRRRLPDAGSVVKVTAGWRELHLPPEEEIPSVGVSQCVRCRRLNFGPCISATCLDLQAAGMRDFRV